MSVKSARYFLMFVLFMICIANPVVSEAAGNFRAGWFIPTEKNTYGAVVWDAAGSAGADALSLASPDSGYLRLMFGFGKDWDSGAALDFTIMLPTLTLISYEDYDYHPSIKGFRFIPLQRRAE